MLMILVECIDNFFWILYFLTQLQKKRDLSFQTKNVMLQKVLTWIPNYHFREVSPHFII